MRTLVQIFAIAVSLLAPMGLLWLMQRRLIYFPDPRPPDPSIAKVLDAEDLAVGTDDGLILTAWYVPPSSEPTGFTILYFGGNGGNRASRADVGAALSAQGNAVILVDYRGYGGNPGDPSEQGLYADALAVRRVVLARPGASSTRLVYFGESLGAGVAVWLATQHTPAALILRSAPSSLVDVGAHHYPYLPVGLLLRDRFPSIDRIAAITAPVLIIVAERDAIVPADLSRRLWNAANEPKQWVVIPDADHNDRAMFDGRQVLDSVRDFLESIAR